MTKESRLFVRLIALWVIFAVSLGVTAWSAKNLADATAKTLTGGYETYYGTTTGYGNYCLIQPVYPMIGSGMMLSTQDQAASDKYFKEQQEYNVKVAEACQAELAKQESAQEGQEKAASIGGIASNLILVLVALASTIASLVFIRKTEVA